jgi:hypothetical protein
MSNVSLAILCALAVHTAEVDGHHATREAGSLELALRANGMWRGYRGSPNPRSGLRQHSDGYWYPEKAFKLVCDGSSPQEGCKSDHSSWCRAKYWSYRESDDTYQPFHGLRRRCVSPLQK